MEHSPLTYTSILSSRAGKEILQSWQWYEERQQGLGDRFVREVVRCIGKIEKTPERYVKRVMEYREVQLDVFPYLVIYRMDKRKMLIRIVSVFHTARSTKKKYG